MMRKLLAALLAALLLAGCGSRADDALSIFAPEESQRLVVYTSHKDAVYGPIITEFQERTGIWVEVVTGGTEELLERIERQKGSAVCDVMFGGGVESLLSYADCFEPYTGAEAALLKPGLRQSGDVCTPFSALTVVLIYNTRLVRPGELQGWSDLLDARWKGKIAFADPAVSGSGYTAVMTMLTALPGDADALLEQFYRNLDGTILSSSGEVPAAVAAGALPVGVTLEETALQRIAQGANLGICYPAEGTSILPDGTALVAGAPHRDNAVAFLEFVQSTDVQERVVKELLRRSVRTDVEDRADLTPADSIPVVDYDVRAASAEKEDFLRRWAGLRGEG